MANTFTAGTPWDPYFYANEAISLLYKALGMARSVYRAYDKDPAQKGSTIRIRKPQAIPTQSMPISTETALAPSHVDVVVNEWHGTEFALVDDELTFSEDMIINDHIAPAAYAIADKIDQTLTALIEHFPWYVADTSAVADIVDLRKILNANKALKGDRFYAIDETVEAAYLKLAVFHQASTATDGERAQREGDLARKFGFDIFSNQNLPTHTKGALVPGTALQLNAEVVAGAKAAVFKDSGGSLTGTVKIGDTFVIAGDTQRYVITADATASGNLITVAFEPGAATTYAASAVVTPRQETKVLNFAAHRNAVALAMAPLSTLGQKLAGANMATVNDPVTGLSLRSTLWYDEAAASVFVRLDALWGVKILDYNLGERLER